MHFAFTEEQSILAETAKAFFAEHATAKRTRAAMMGDGIDAALWRGFTKELGLSGIALAEECGGTGLGMVELAIVAEAAGARVAALPMLGSLALAAQALAAGGSDAQRKAWLPLLASGEKIASCSIKANVSARGGKLSGEAELLPHGGRADMFVLGNDSGAWLVERGAPGADVRALTTMDQTRPFARIALKDVAAESLVEPARALAAAKRGGWLCVAAEALGGAQACLEQTVAYSLQRVQFGRPIGSFQAYKHRLADMMIEIEQARSAVYWAACAVDENAPEATLALHAAKSFAADTFMMCAGNMIQLHGGIGFTWEHDAHLYFKRAKALHAMLGSGDWHREQVAKLMNLGDAA